MKNRRLQAWIKYLFSARSKFRIHSPFLFDLVINVFEDKSTYGSYLTVENLWKKLKKNKNIVNKQDFGTAGSRPVQQIRVSDIAAGHSISKQYGRLLYRIAKRFGPKKILELGTSLGKSTSYLALACPGSKIITIEGCPETAALAADNFKSLGIDNVEIAIGNFKEVLPDVLQRSGQLDLIFIDGNHRKQATIDYFSSILPLVHRDTVLIIDDIHWSHEMEEVWQEICRSGEVTFSVDLFQFGILFFKKELCKQDFVIRYV